MPSKPLLKKIRSPSRKIIPSLRIKNPTINDKFLNKFNRPLFLLEKVGSLRMFQAHFPSTTIWIINPFFTTNIAAINSLATLLWESMGESHWCFNLRNNQISHLTSSRRQRIWTEIFSGIWYSFLLNDHFIHHIFSKEFLPLKLINFSTFSQCPQTSSSLHLPIPLIFQAWH